MFELPEFVTLARQINAALTGKTIRKGNLGNTPHKFVWYNTSHAEFARLTQGKTVGKAWAKGKWLFIPLEPGYVLLLGECGGKVLYHPAGSRLPAKYHLCLAFDYFSTLIDSLLEGQKRSVKGLLTQEQLVPGLGNAIAQDIFFRAGLHPRRPIEGLNKAQRRKLYNAIVKTVGEAITKRGRYDEYDLYNQPGRYIRRMDNKAVGHSCPKCGSKIENIQYLGGACYFCPGCQK